ncbi:ABC transporter permease [Clostridium neuense]|uniref:ABC transporter permease n=1 Tax=Clostridium neuense TaxID=1728934 RepID=A0ABW8TNK5_9CLOT
MVKDILWLMLNTFKISFSKKINLIGIIIIPICAILLSIMVSTKSSSNPIDVGILDNDKSSMSKDFVKNIKSQDDFNIILVSEKDGENKLTAGDIDCNVIIPKGFEKSIYDNRIKKLYIKSLKGSSATAWVDNYTNIYLNNIMDTFKASGNNINVFNKIYKNSKVKALELNIEKVKNKAADKEITSRSIGFFIMIVMMNASISCGFILKEKKNRAYLRIRSSKVSSKSYVLANIFAGLVVAAVQIFAALIIMVGIFKINTYVQFWQLFIILLCFAISAVGLGILIVSFCKNSNSANYAITLIITPSCMVGGCFIPTNLMPETIQKISYFLPQKWTIDAIEKLQNGSSFASISSYILVILAFAVTFFIIAAYGFSRDQNVKIFE